MLISLCISYACEPQFPIQKCIQAERRAKYSINHYNPQRQIWHKKLKTKKIRWCMMALLCKIGIVKKESYMLNFIIPNNNHNTLIPSCFIRLYVIVITKLIQHFLFTLILFMPSYKTHRDLLVMPLLNKLFYPWLHLLLMDLQTTESTSWTSSYC